MKRKVVLPLVLLLVALTASGLFGPDERVVAETGIGSTVSEPGDAGAAPGGAEATPGGAAAGADAEAGGQAEAGSAASESGDAGAAPDGAEATPGGAAAGADAEAGGRADAGSAASESGDAGAAPGGAEATPGGAAAGADAEAGGQAEAGSAASESGDAGVAPGGAEATPGGVAAGADAEAGGRAEAGSQAEAGSAVSESGDAGAAPGGAEVTPEDAAAAAGIIEPLDGATSSAAGNEPDSAAIIAASGPAGPLKGPYGGVSPMMRVYAAGAVPDEAAPLEGLNEAATPAPGALQKSGIEVRYQWRPSASMLVSQVQFYSSAPGRAIVRLYLTDPATGRPGQILAQSGFDSQAEGWQGGVFGQAAAVEAGGTYWISYAHEKEITNYLTLDRRRDKVSFYWNELAFGELAERGDAPAAPELIGLQANGAQVKLEWSASADKAGDSAAIGGANDSVAAGAIHYEVFRNGVLLGTTSMLYAIDDLGPSAQAAVYTYTVRAVRAGQRSAFSNALTAALPAAAPQAAAQPLGTPASVPEEAGAQAPQSPQEPGDPAASAPPSEAAAPPAAAQSAGAPADAPDDGGAAAPSAADPPPGAPQNAPVTEAATPQAAAPAAGAPLIGRAPAPPLPVRQASLHRR
ncbi:DUF4082 domain-containing protein [Paenibacillus athensensis]|uniref:DUF4082 domain-containing protein n=1 Tax=Paenibacillus athensensis TaxID=1967502 RepID=UPI001E3F1D64|nr:DUF4082 domain-containing protein [Paenibacillus athensensis]MCD1261049.1 DUF4082 domain-containing protein [Paenibacillus athensensis]